MRQLSILFEHELARRGVRYVKIDDIHYKLTSTITPLEVSLANLIKEQADIDDATLVLRFVDKIVVVESLIDLPPWEKAAGNVFLSIERVSSEVVDLPQKEITESISQIWKYVDFDLGVSRFIQLDDLARWNVAIDEFVAVASANLAALLAKTKIEVERMEEFHLGMLYPQIPSMKASLVLAPTFRSAVEPQLGWPLYAILPCRDFVYLIPCADKDLLSWLGPTIREEYEKSAYPLTTDIFRVDQDNLEVAFTFE